MQPNTTATALVILMYIASSIAGMRTNKTNPGVQTAPGIQTTSPTPQTEKNAVLDLASRSAAISETANVRSGPGTNYPKTGKLAKNTPVRLVSQANGWYQVSLPNGGYGWVAGSLLRIGQPSGAPAQLKHDVVGYYTVNYPGDKSSYNVLDSHSRSLTAIAPFSYAVDRAGNVTGEHFHDAMEIASSRGLSNLALVHNLNGKSFNQSDIHSMLNSKAARERAIRDIYDLVKKNGYDGVNIDFENVPPGDRRVLTQFMQELRSKLGPAGYKVTMSVPAKYKDSPSSAWIGAFDYYALGKVCDQIMLMTYDQHTSGTGPGPVASVQWVEKVIKYAMTQMPKKKILVGIAAYGYDWNTSTNRAKAISYSQAIRTAERHGTKISWDNASQSPYFRYKSGNVTREVWFESADSMSAKLKLVKKHDLGGIAIWRLGQEDAGYWKVIERELQN
ncbi:MAG TPA: glycosyl hydrolase family 18 protein [Bacillota bacterium]|nr:glycosyl hydrolase family 18 protein [Bacillota bacterium]HOO30346.1 glycosyl hydrolase family 18 protein [Bacillota bacterium]HPZ13758.1 glycosyl hydrolase family 18 protein [Bacillota bacterium]HQD81085.1 glycosyl hydrolase family 18 protein [Bacillota bacterium]